MSDLPNRWRARLDVLATLAMISASGALVWAVVSSVGRVTPSEAKALNSPRRPKPIPTTPISLDGTAVRGLAAARVGVIEFSDFECPYCARFHERTYPRVLSEYVNTGKVLFAFRHLPIEQIHAGAFRAAEAAECADAQGKFWPMVDMLFQPPRTFDAEALAVRAERAGLVLPRFELCLAGEVAEEVRRDIREAKALGINSTPSFLMGVMGEGGRLKVLRHESGAVPPDAFVRMLDELLGTASK